MSRDPSIATWPGDDPRATLALWDYRRQVAATYARVRALPPVDGWRLWREQRDQLFASHPQSALAPDARPAFDGLPVFDYDPELRVSSGVGPATPRRIALPHSGAGATPAHAFGVARFSLGGADRSLTLFWLDDYGGGVFVPFRDATNGQETYGGGRYLLDTAKGADLGHGGGAVTLDFNFAYHPSCVHDPRWSCPLSPPENHLDVPVRGGERL